MSILNMNPMPAQNMPIMLRIWPDNIWAIIEDIREGEFDHKSDDFQEIDFFDILAFTALPKDLQDEIVAAVLGEDPAQP